MKTGDLKRDKRNANKGTKRGRALLEKSLREYGTGRSVLLDRNGNVIAGNKTVDAASKLGITDVIVVPTDGTQIVAVQRTDLDIDSPVGRGLAYADNRVGELDLAWDAKLLLEDIEAGVDLSTMFDDSEINALLQSVVQDDADHVSLLSKITATSAAEPSMPANDIAAEWVGMPEFENRDIMGKYVIKVWLADDAALASFAELVGQKVTPQTKFIWHPQQERLDLTPYRNR